MFTEEALKAIIAGGETLTVEFKSDRGPLQDTDLLEAVVCLANTKGGKLIVGVENDGRVTGLHPRHSDSASHLLAALVTNRTVPPLAVEAEFVDLSEGRIAILDVPAVPQMVSTSDGRTLIRHLDTHGHPKCRPLYPTEINSWYADRGQRDTTARLMTNAKWEDLDPLEFIRLRRLLNEYRGDASLLDLSDKELARALGFVQRHDVIPTLAGLLVVGREEALREQVPTHEVAFQVLRGQDVAINEFYRWPLLRVFERIMEAFSLRNEESELTVDLFRVGIPAYDPRAFREAVNNALTHRDYNRMGTVHVQTHDNAIVIRNPGGLMEGLRLDNLLNTGPVPRNPLLADIFKRLGLVERTGRGIGLIYSGQLRTGRLLPDYSGTTNHSVAVRLPGGESDLDFVKIILLEEKRLKRSFSLDELLMLSLLRRERELNLAEAGRLIQKGEDEARRVLEELTEDGLIERLKTSRQREYMLSASMYRHMGKPEAYIRRRGFEPLQMEQMVLQYTTKHGRITRSEVMNLCKINRNQASHLLRKLVHQGLLQKMGTSGTGRGVHYVLPQAAISEEATVNMSINSQQRLSLNNTNDIDISIYSQDVLSKSAMSEDAKEDTSINSQKRLDSKNTTDINIPLFFQLELDLENTIDE
ncbi:putative DNA binding domain-containing protein [Microcoleus sp. FACHB-53]|nr:putative DNA binding domain-containing protein [Microcoleus sp. FACHB-53]